MLASPGVAGAALEPPGPGPDLPEDAGVEDDQGRHGHQMQNHVHARGALGGGEDMLMSVFLLCSDTTRLVRK